MPVENYTTKISATRTASEIQELLADHGVSQIMLEYAERRPVGVVFATQTALGPRTFRLPVNVQAMHRLLVSEKKAGRLPGISAAVAQDLVHAERVAWRVVAERLRAQMTLVASEMATFDQVMLPYLMVDDSATLYEQYREHGLRALEKGHP